MGNLVELVTPLHKATKRDYLARMNDDKVHCMEVARQYGKDYWDGDRRYGYGGYRYDGRWKPVAEKLIYQYNLGPRCSILDVGCGKAHLLHELKLLLPHATIRGFDISEYGIADAPEAIRPALDVCSIQNRWSFRDDWQEPDHQFDLVISLGCLHNLEVFDLDNALRGITYAGRQHYVMVESYRNAQELFNLECWALTCHSFFSDREWKFLFKQFGYYGDYEFIYFE